MNLLFRLAVVPLFAAPFLSLGQIHCPKPVIPDSQKLNQQQVQNQPNGTADLPSVIASVTSAMQCYQDNRGTGADALPKLSSAVFDFKTTTGTVGGLTFSIFILKIGGSVEKDSVNDLSFTYSVPAKPPARGIIKKEPQQLSDALANNILAAAKAVQTSQSVLGLPLDKVSINVQYGIKFDGNVLLNVPVQLVTLGPSAGHNKASTQSVTLTFEK